MASAGIHFIFSFCCSLSFSSFFHLFFILFSSFFHRFFILFSSFFSIYSLAYNLQQHCLQRFHKKYAHFNLFPYLGSSVLESRTFDGVVRPAKRVLANRAKKIIDDKLVSVRERNFNRRDGEYMNILIMRMMISWIYFVLFCFIS